MNKDNWAFNFLLKLWSLLWGPGSPIWVLSLISLVTILISEKMGWIGGADSIVVGDINLISLVTKLLAYMISFGFIVNYLSPKIKEASQMIFEKSLEPELEKVKHTISNDLDGIKQRSIRMLLRDSTVEQKEKATKDLFEIKYGKWIAHKRGFVTACLKIAEDASKHPYFRHDNDKLVKLKNSNIPNFLRWIEVNNYAIIVNIPNNQASEDCKDIDYGKHDIEFYSSIEILNDNEELQKAFSNYYFTLNYRAKSESKYSPLLTIEPKDFDISKGKIASKSENMKVDMVVRGGKIKVKIIITFKAKLNERVNYFSTKEESLIHKDDNTYTLSVSRPFRRGSITFEVPDDYSITSYNLCTSSSWNPVDEHMETKSLSRIYTKTEEWVMPGLYFFVRWQILADMNKEKEKP